MVALSYGRPTVIDQASAFPFRTRPDSVIPSVRLLLFCHPERAKRVEGSSEAWSDTDPSDTLHTRRGFVDSVGGLPRSK